MYEVVQQDKPIVPPKVHLGLDEQIVDETAVQNPYAAALQKDIDSEYHEEPLSALNKADLSWSILTTHVQYTTAIQYSCFKLMNDSPLFRNFKEKQFDETECVEDVSDEHFKEVSCELQTSSNFEEHVNMTTMYL